MRLRIAASWIALTSPNPKVAITNAKCPPQGPVIALSIHPGRVQLQPCRPNKQRPNPASSETSLTEHNITVTETDVIKGSNLPLIRRTPGYNWQSFMNNYLKKKTNNMFRSVLNCLQFFKIIWCWLVENPGSSQSLLLLFQKVNKSGHLNSTMYNVWLIHLQYYEDNDIQNAFNYLQFLWGKEIIITLSITLGNKNIWHQLEIMQTKGSKGKLWIF